MATNKLASIRYRVLDRCFRDQEREYTIDDLREACNQALFEYAEANPNILVPTKVSEKTIYNDIAFMETSSGWSIELERKRGSGHRPHYRYKNPEFSINYHGLNKEETAQIKDLIIMLSRFKGFPMYGWVEELMATLEGRFNIDGHSANIIGFEQNKELKGLHYLTKIIESTVNTQVLDIEYASKKGTLNWTIHPYYIKQYNNRWYLHGLNNERNAITCVALDRILSLNNNNDVEFKPNTKFDFEHYFDDVIGVTIPTHEAKKETVVLRFSEHRFPMIISKPIHHSQKEVCDEPNTIELDVIPNKELEQQILSYGNDVEVIAPRWMREEIFKKILDLYKKYQLCNSIAE